MRNSLWNTVVLKLGTVRLELSSREQLGSDELWLEPLGSVWLSRLGEPMTSATALVDSTRVRFGWTEVDPNLITNRSHLNPIIN